MKNHHPLLAAMLPPAFMSVALLTVAVAVALAVAPLPADAANATKAAQAAKTAKASEPNKAMDSWQSTYNQAQTAYAAGDLGAAEPSARKALALAKAGKGETQSFIASSLNLLALVRQKQGHGDEAVGLLRDALAASSSAKEGANTAALALNLGQALEAQKQPDQALEAYQRSLDTVNALPPSDASTPVRSQALQALSRLYAERGDAARAGQYNQQLLANTQSLPREQQVEALRRQAQLQQSQKQTDAAAASLRQALALYDGAGDAPHADGAPNDVQNRIALLTDLASVYDDAGRYDDAEPSHRQAVDLLKQTDPQGKAMAAHLNELGLWYLQRKEFPQALDLLQQAQGIVSTADAQSLETARITANLAQAHEANGDADQAITLYQQTLAIYEVHGKEPEALLGQAQALNFLAGQDYRRRRFAQAEPQFLRALSLTEEAAGPNSPRLLPLLDNIVALYTSQQRPAQAAPYAKRADELRQRSAP